MGCTSLTEVSIPEGVTSIGNYAFSACTSLTEISIPNSVTSIGISIFNGCTGLTGIIWNGSEYSTADAFMDAFNKANA